MNGSIGKYLSRLKQFGQQLNLVIWTLASIWAAVKWLWMGQPPSTITINGWVEAVAITGIIIGTPVQYYWVGAQESKRKARLIFIRRAIAMVKGDCQQIQAASNRGQLDPDAARILQITHAKTCAELLGVGIDCEHGE